MSGRSDWNVEEEVELLRAAGDYLTSSGFEAANVGIVLGSGHKHVADAFDDRIEIPFEGVHAFPKVRVPGQGGKIIQGTVGGTRVHCLTGRVHQYEGYDEWKVVRAVRTLALLGTKTFVLTNAAGGIREDLSTGSLMLIVDHINLTGTNALQGPHHQTLGPRFPSMSEVYCKKARKVLRAADPGDGLKEGVYAQVLGPSYETPAEIRMMRTLGGDAVGMSTVPEAMALSAMGCRVAGLSLITNRAAGLTKRAPNHDEVVEEGRRAAERMKTLLLSAIPDLARLSPGSAKRGHRPARRRSRQPRRESER